MPYRLAQTCRRFRGTCYLLLCISLPLSFFPLSFIHIPSSCALRIFLLGMCYYKTAPSAATDSNRYFHGVMSPTSPMPSNTHRSKKKYLVFYIGYGSSRFVQYVADWHEQTSVSSNTFSEFNVHGSVHRNNILVYNSNKMHKSQSLFYLTTALHVSGVTITHLQGHNKIVTTASGNRYNVLLSAAIIEDLERALVCCGWLTPHTTHSNQF
jgi:hypothetical protein